MLQSTSLSSSKLALSFSNRAPWPAFTQEEADAVSRVLLSNKVNYWTGTETRTFEDEFAAFAGTRHAIALANGTVALDLALHGLGIGAVNGGNPSDEVIVTPRTFIASVSCVLNAGAIPVFADVGLESQNIEPETVAPVLTPRTRAIICVHLAGWPCDMDGLRNLVGGQDIALIEDCAQAHGALYKGRPVGGLGDVGAWSFCQDKIMTTGGEGGMVTCNDPDIWARMWAFKDHGKSYAKVMSDDHPPGFRWLHDSIGTNWRMTEMQSAIGRIQLRRMPDWHAARAANANELTEALRPFAGVDGPLRLPHPTCAGCAQSKCMSSRSGCHHAWYRYYAFTTDEGEDAAGKRDALIARFSALGLRCMQGTCSEVYRERALEAYSPAERLSNARRLGETSIVFFVHPGQIMPHADDLIGLLSTND